MKKQPDECADCAYIKERATFVKAVDEMNAMKDDVKAIKDALLGTEFTEGEGLIHKVNEHDKYIQANKMKWAKIGGIAVVISFIVSAVVAKWTWIVDKL